MPQPLTRRSFCAFSAVALASLGLPQLSFADETTDTTATTEKIVIVHTNDVHCAVDNNLGYAKLVDYVKAQRLIYGETNLTLVDAGDAVQGKAMGTLTSGEYLIDIMNQCEYDLAIPGNHEFDFGMTQFNTNVALANAQYLSCNFTDLRTGNLMLSPYVIKEYTTTSGTIKVAFVGICTPETLTKSSPAHFQDDEGTCIYGFCEDDSGQALYDAVQNAVDSAQTEGVNYVVAIAHLGQAGSTTRWSSASVAAQTYGIDVIIDGHSHEEYVQTLTNAKGNSVLVTQTGTQLVSIGNIEINPSAQTLTASTPSCSCTLVTEWDGSDAATAAYIADKQTDIEKITSQVIGESEVRLVALEDDNYTWAVRTHETNLANFVADAYLALAWYNGIVADVAFINGGGIRANIEEGTVTYGSIIDVQPYNNQLCYIKTTGQNILDALEMGSSALPEQTSSLQHVSGMSYTVRTDIESSVVLDNGNFAGVDGEYRVRNVSINDEPLDVTKTYSLVSHTFLIMDGGDGMTMFQNDEPILLDLDNAALIQYLQYDLQGAIGEEYADQNGQGRLTLQVGPDPEPEPEPDPEPEPEPDPTPDPDDTDITPDSDSDTSGSTDAASGSNAQPLAATGDVATVATMSAAAVAGLAGAAVLGATCKQR